MRVLSGRKGDEELANLSTTEENLLLHLESILPNAIYQL